MRMSPMRPATLEPINVFIWFAGTSTIYCVIRPPSFSKCFGSATVITMRSTGINKHMTAQWMARKNCTQCISARINNTFGGSAMTFRLIILLAVRRFAMCLCSLFYVRGRTHNIGRHMNRFAIHARARTKHGNPEFPIIRHYLSYQMKTIIYRHFGTEWKTEREKPSEKRVPGAGRWNCTSAQISPNRKQNATFEQIHNIKYDTFDSNTNKPHLYKMPNLHYDNENGFFGKRVRACANVWIGQIFGPSSIHARIR